MDAPQKTFDPIAEYLKARRCPSHVVRAGLKGLVMAWEKVAHELTFDGYRYGLRDFLGDLERRELLAGAIEAVRGAIPEDFSRRIAAADRRFLDGTEAASRCLLGDEAARLRGIGAERSFWFYRLPRRHRAGFARDLEGAGIAPLPR